MSQARILPIEPGDVLDNERLADIYFRAESLYWSSDWSPEFYVLLARAGFISTSFAHPSLGELLIPEIQSHYAVLDWDTCHCERSMRRWQRSSRFADQNYRLTIGYNLASIVDGIQKVHGEETWLKGRYVKLLQELTRSDFDPGFRLMTVALFARDHDLIAGEVGYEIGSTYTSLSGFCHRKNPIDKHVGKLQLHLLAKELERRGFSFWNLGHPGMDYKIQLGAKVLPRQEFLRRWTSATR